LLVVTSRLSTLPSPQAGRQDQPPHPLPAALRAGMACRGAGLLLPPGQAPPGVPLAVDHQGEAMEEDDEQLEQEGEEQQQQDATPHAAVRLRVHRPRVGGAAASPVWLLLCLSRAPLPLNAPAPVPV
jgi:hypothetical protein